MSRKTVVTAVHGTSVLFEVEGPEEDSGEAVGKGVFMLPEPGGTFLCKSYVNNEVTLAGSLGQWSRLGLTPSQGARKVSPRSQPNTWGPESSDQSFC